ncbi:uncharacterized protein [Procambarus clarkii]|uniref:uncharacterized protein n=1 Tax=Procambarus clarkii TaxID=6728 RepID=UPI0037425835
MSYISNNRSFRISTGAVTNMLLCLILFLVLGVCRPGLGAEEEEEEEVKAVEVRQLNCPWSLVCLWIWGQCVPNNSTINCRYNFTNLCGSSCYCCWGRRRALNVDDEEADIGVKVEQLIHLRDGVQEADDAEEMEQQERRNEVQKNEVLVLKDMRDTLKMEALGDMLEGIEEMEREEEIVKRVSQLDGKDIEMKDGESAASLVLKQIDEKALCATIRDRCHQLGGSCSSRGKNCDLMFPPKCMLLPCSCCVDCGEKNNSLCNEHSGHCRKECLCTEYRNTTTPCNSVYCSCCQACRATPDCRSGPNTGRCVADPTCCNSVTSYVSSDGCVTENCVCCKTCRREQKCADVAGYCITATGTCNPGYVAFSCGCNDGNSCKCCVPESNQAKFSC